MSTSAVSDESTVVAGVDLVDPELAVTVRDGLAAVEKLLVDELSDGEEFLQEAALHLARAGGKRFRPLFTVLTGQLGPNPTDPALITAWRAPGPGGWRTTHLAYRAPSALRNTAAPDSPAATGTQPTSARAPGLSIMPMPTVSTT
ncbi:hypothetical protein ACFWF3_27310, partial [Nocardia sp. NPDC060220]